MNEFLVELMLANTDFSEEEIYEMDLWEIYEHLAFN